MGLDDDFKLGIAYVQNLPPKGAVDLSNSQKLLFYALYKQGSAGPCTTKPPSKLQIVARAKYDAWKGLGDKLSKEAAKKRYIEELTKISPNWKKDSDKLRSKL